MLFRSPRPALFCVAISLTANPCFPENDIHDRQPVHQARQSPDDPHLRDSRGGRAAAGAGRLADGGAGAVFPGVLDRRAGLARQRRARHLAAATLVGVGDRAGRALSGGHGGVLLDRVFAQGLHLLSQVSGSAG